MTLIEEIRNKCSPELLASRDHDDEDLAVRQAALQAVADHITAELQAASERVQVKVQAALAGPSGD